MSKNALLLPSCEIREAFVIRRTSEGKDAIAINTSVTGEDFIQLFAAHAFDGITPKSLHFSNDAHGFGFVVRLTAIRSVRRVSSTRLPVVWDQAPSVRS
jgi:hypothetical protein